MNAFSFGDVGFAARLGADTVPGGPYVNNAATVTDIDLTGFAHTSVSCPNLTDASGFINAAAQLGDTLTSFSCPLLENVGTYLTIGDNENLATVDLGSLENLGWFIGNNNLALTSLSLPALLTCSVGYFDCSASINLVTVDLGNVIFADANLILFFGCALDEATVDHILARCVASGLTAATIQLHGGTSAPPSVTGDADKATLIGNGCSVSTN